MIKSISSNQFSSQHRAIDISGIKAQIQEIETKIRLSEKEESQGDFEIPKEKVKELEGRMNSLLEGSTTSLKFEFHEKLNEYFVKIIDEKTKEVVREIPSKKMLDFYAAMTEFLGLIVDKKI